MPYDAIAASESKEVRSTSYKVNIIRGTIEDGGCLMMA